MFVLCFVTQDACSTAAPPIAEQQASARDQALIGGAAVIYWRRSRREGTSKLNFQRFPYVYIEWWFLGQVLMDAPALCVS